MTIPKLKKLDGINKFHLQTETIIIGKTAKKIAYLGLDHSQNHSSGYKMTFLPSFNPFFYYSRLPSNNLENDFPGST